MNTARLIGIMLATLALCHQGHAQCQRQKLVASDAERSDEFSYCVTVDGEWAAVSAPFDDDLFDQSGAVYLFHRVGGTWVETQRLKASDASFGATFGLSIAMADNVLVVGAAWDSSMGLSTAGSAYVFELTGDVWSESVKLIATDIEAGAFFGTPLTTDGNRIAVAAPEDNEHGPDSGAVYVFDRIGGIWTQTAKLVASDAGPYDIFGDSVALLGDTILVGDPNKEGPAGEGQGAAYLFEKGPTGWSETKKLLASNGAAYDFLGTSVALQAGRAFVGGTGRDHGPNLGNSGTVFCFEHVGSDWVQSQEFWPNDLGDGDQFGTRMAASPDHLIVTADGDDGTGSAYDFRHPGSTWIQAGKMLGSDATDWSLLGTSAAISGETVLISDIGDWSACPGDMNCFSGAAYVFELAPTAVQFGDCLSTSPCGNYDNHGGCRNSSGQGSILAACGSGSVTTDDLQLEVTHCPPNKLALLFMAPAQASVLYGDGLRVVKAQGGVALYRLGAQNADAQGSLVRGPGLVAQTQTLPPPGRIQAGQTWNFQVWHRDSVSQGPCHTGTNFTNGVQVAFGP